MVELVGTVSPRPLFLLLAEELAWPDKPTLTMKKCASFDVFGIHHLLKSEEGRAAVLAEFPELQLARPAPVPMRPE